MFRHVVVFTFTPETTLEQQEELASQLRTLPGAIGEIQDYHVGLDAGLNPGNYQFAVVADFGNVEDYLVYRDHPVHREIIEKYVQPIVASRAAVQYEIDL
jgi:Stress responsive A/B Barrel Domain